MSFRNLLTELRLPGAVSSPLGKVSLVRDSLILQPRRAAVH